MIIPIEVMFDLQIQNYYQKWECRRITILIRLSSVALIQPQGMKHMPIEQSKQTKTLVWCGSKDVGILLELDSFLSKSNVCGPSRTLHCRLESQRVQPCMGPAGYEGRWLIFDIYAPSYIMTCLRNRVYKLNFR